MAASTPEDFRWGMMPAPKWEGDETQTMYNIHRADVDSGRS